MSGRAQESSVALMRGELTGKDSTVSRGSLGDYYSFQGYTGDWVEIDLSSGPLDCYLYLYDGSGQLIAEDDDSGDGYDSALSTSLPSDGIYLVVATSFAPEEGGYQLRVERSASNTGLAGADYPLLPTPNTFNGRFEASSPVDANGSPYLGFAIELAAFQTVVIEMHSVDADSYLVLFGPQGNWVAEDDDSLGNYNPIITYTAQQAGLHFIVATTYSAPGSSASFDLTVR